MLDSFLSKGTLQQIPAKGYIIEPGTIDKSVWITATGVTKAIYFDGKKECVLGFSGPGTITMSPISFVIGKPAFCGFQAITNCNMVKVSKSDFETLMNESHEFARWMFGIAVGQLCALELKAQMLSESDVISNYNNMLKRQMKLDENGFDPNRPNLLSIVSSKDIASYLGITQSYLSNLRKMLHEQQRQSKNP
ncbi:MAG: Crp/Fnr family transcriptional regulator [Muribaculaceae bacterium]|nr:Crp/Fnr family transcriptional regulator [Muribaculaceae bacterium]